MTPGDKELYEVKLTAQTALQMIRDHAADCIAARARGEKGFADVRMDIRKLERTQYIALGICLTVTSLTGIIGAVFMVWKMTHGNGMA